MAGCNSCSNWQTKSVDCSMNFGGQAAFGTPNTGSFSPPFAPDASACVLQIVASTNTYSKSGSALNALKTLSQTPPIAQRLNRECTVRQLPSSGGRSRHGAAPRASQRIASRNSRLSAPPPVTLFTRYQRLNDRPLPVCQSSSAQDRLPVFDLESKIGRFGNPLNADAT